MIRQENSFTSVFRTKARLGNGGGRPGTLDGKAVSAIDANAGKGLSPYERQ